MNWRPNAGQKNYDLCNLECPAEAFNNPEQQLMQGKSTSDLFLNIASNYRFCGYEILKNYNCFDFRNADMGKSLENYPAYLEKVFGL
jgi:NADPH dehydrogenase (quinone)